MLTILKCAQVRRATTHKHAHTYTHQCRVICPLGWTIVVVVCIYATSSVTWSLFRGSSTGEVLSTSVIPGRKGWRKRGREEEREVREREEGTQEGRKMHVW